MGKPIGVAVIGTGYIGQSAHLPAYQKMQDEGKVRLVALCDIAPDALKTASDKFRRRAGLY